VTNINIESEAFYGCSGLTSITLPWCGFDKNFFGYLFGASSYSDQNSYIPASLKTVIINGGNSVPANAFYGCSGLTNVTIGNSVTSIGNGAFYGCSRLSSITIPFVGATLNGTSNTHFSYIFGAPPNEADTYKYISSQLRTVVITGGNSIYSIAFYNCGSLTSIAIPDCVSSIGDGAFYGCDSLTSVTIPNIVTSIGSNTFQECTNLKSVTIPDSVISIGNYAFMFSGLTSVTFQGKIPLANFDIYGFNGDLRDKFYATNTSGGTPGTYTRPSTSSSTWTRQN